MKKKIIFVSLLLFGVVLGTTSLAKEPYNMHFLPFEPGIQGADIENNNGPVVPGCACFITHIEPTLIDYEYFGGEQILKTADGCLKLPLGATVEFYAHTVPPQLGVYWTEPQGSHLVELQGSFISNPVTYVLTGEGMVTIEAYCTLGHSEQSFNSITFEII